jgi:hypothetical protein
MPTFEIPVDATKIEALPPDTAKAIDEFLRGKGYDVDGVTIQVRPTPAIVIDADRDPTADIKGWNPVASADADRIQTAKRIAADYRDKVAAGQTVTATETSHALAATITLLAQLADTA